MNNFPVEVLVNIFQHLQQNDLIRVSEVCLKFNQVVTDFKLIRRLILTARTITNAGGDESAVTLTRKYDSVILRDRELLMAGIPQHILQVFTNHIVKLTLNQCSLKMTHVQEILKRLTKVKFIHFDYVEISDEDFDATVDLPQVKNVDLIFEESDPKIFKLLSSVSVSSVDLKFYGDTPYSNFNDFVLFAKLQTQLEKFKVSGVYESNLFLIPMGKSNFRLKEFAVRNCDFEEYGNFELFLLDHIETMEKISISEVVSWDCSSIVARFKKLRVFEAKQTMLEFMQDMPTVRELVWEAPMRFNAIQNFANVRKLQMRQCPQATNQFVNNLALLRELKLFLGNVDGLHLPELRKLELRNCQGLTADFFRVHRKIEKLHLEVYELNDEILLSIVTNLSKLKELTICDNNHLTAEAFNIIADNCKSLKTIEITHWVQKFTNGEWKAMTKINGLQIYMRDL